MLKAMPTILTDSSVAIQVDTANGPQVNQLQQQKVKLKMAKYKIIAAVVLGLAFIVGTVQLVYTALSSESAPQQQVFQFILHDPSSSIPIDLNVKVDHIKNVDYMTSPAVDENNNRIGDVNGIRDGKSGFEAYAYEDGDNCLIGKITAQDMFGNYNKGSITERNVNVTMRYSLLNQTIHPYVLGLVAGDNVVEFCANRSAVWMIHNKDNNLHGRQKRHHHYHGGGCWWGCGYWGCYQQCC